MSSTQELEKARAAKEKAKSVFGRLAHYSGVGLTYRSGHYSVKVLLSDDEEKTTEYPDSIDGIPVEFQVIGKVHKQSVPGGETEPD